MSNSRRYPRASNMEHKDFCVFIISNRRAGNVKTIKLLDRSGYTGPWYVVVDDLDPMLDEYRKEFRDRLLIFDKVAMSEKVPLSDNTGDLRSDVFARNACFDLAEDLGYTHFLELDDDYNDLQLRYADNRGMLRHVSISDADQAFDAMLDFLDDTGALSVAYAQTGDFIGGADGGFWQYRGVYRKAMNSWFCRIDRRFEFIGRLNDDVNTYTVLGSRGGVFFTVRYIAVNQAQTQTTPGGMSEAYLDSGTYAKSFTSVMMLPSAIRIGTMGEKYRRIHHSIRWNNCVPMILHERYRKSGE